MPHDNKYKISLEGVLNIFLIACYLARQTSKKSYQYSFVVSVTLYLIIIWMTLKLPTEILTWPYFGNCYINLLPTCIMYNLPTQIEKSKQAAILETKKKTF